MGTGANGRVRLAANTIDPLVYELEVSVEHEDTFATDQRGRAIEEYGGTYRQLGKTLSVLSRYHNQRPC